MVSPDHDQNLQQRVLPNQGPQPEPFTHFQSIADKVAASFDRGVVRVLFTDIDATFVLGAGHHQSEIDQGQRDMRALVRRLNDEHTIIIPVSGSHFDSGTSTTNSILNRIGSGVLPMIDGESVDRSYHVDAYVSDGGARAVHGVQGRSVEYDARYVDSVQPDNLNYNLIAQRAKQLAAEINLKPLTDSERNIVRQYDAHANESRIHLQPGTESGVHAQSNKFALYFYASSLAERDAIEESFTALSRELGVRIVCCEEKDANSAARRHATYQAHGQGEGYPLKYCLDIVPFDKGSAVSHFSAYISSLISDRAVASGSTARPRMEVWAAGDSGNDITLMAPDVVTNVVIVGGASPELIRLGDRLEAQGKEVYIERDPSRIGPASIAAAIFKDS